MATIKHPTFGLEYNMSSSRLTSASEPRPKPKIAHRSIPSHEWPLAQIVVIIVIIVI